MNIIVDRLYRHRFLNGGVFMPVHTGQALIKTKRCVMSTTPYWGTMFGKYLPLFSPDDNKLYVLYFGPTWTRNGAGLETNVLRLRTRKNPQLCLGDIRHLRDGSGFSFFYNSDYAVDSRRNVIVGEVIKEGKPNWLVEYELDELFS